MRTRWYHWLAAVVLAFCLAFLASVVLSACGAPLVGGYVGQSQPEGDASDSTEFGVIVLGQYKEDPKRPPQPSDDIQRDDDLERGPYDTHETVVVAHEDYLDDPVEASRVAREMAAHERAGLTPRLVTMPAHEPHECPEPPARPWWEDFGAVQALISLALGAGLLKGGQHVKEKGLPAMPWKKDRA